MKIEILPSSAADDKPLVAALTGLVNAVYGDAEAGIYKAGFERTSQGDIAELIRAGQLAVAFLSPSNPKTNPNPTTSLPQLDTTPSPPHRQHGNPIGCVCIKQLTPTTGEFGMLALDPAYRGGGLGRDLVCFAETRCQKTLNLKTMRLELLVPVHFEHVGKARLQAWYERMGYVLVGLYDFAVEYPRLSELLRGETEYRVFEKRLGSGI